MEKGDFTWNQVYKSGFLKWFKRRFCFLRACYPQVGRSKAKGPWPHCYCLLLLWGCQAFYTLINLLGIFSYLLAVKLIECQKILLITSLQSPRWHIQRKEEHQIWQSRANMRRFGLFDLIHFQELYYFSSIHFLCCARAEQYLNTILLSWYEAIHGLDFGYCERCCIFLVLKATSE